MSNFSELKIDLVLVFVPFKIIPNGMISPHYDYEEFKIELDSWFKPLGIKWEWIPITLLNFRDEILYAKELEKKSKLVVFNLCDGTETDFYPGLSIIRELKKNEIPFTGGDEQFYKLSTEKILTKNKLLEHSISTAPFIEILNPEKDIKRAEIAIGYPFILKPNISAGNFGIYLKSVVHNFHSAVEVAEDLIQEQINEYGENANSYFAERFIIGNEYTVLVVGNYKYPDDIIIYKPIQRIFDNSLPEQEKFLSFHRYWNHYDDEANISLEPFTTEITEYYTYQLVESSFEDKLIQHSKQAFCALEGTGYARIDIRYDSILEQFFILEVNSNCGLSNESSSSVGNILNLANKSISSLIEKILYEAFITLRSI
jgi:D-alanine-D-alanine ligase